MPYVWLDSPSAKQLVTASGAKLYIRKSSDPPTNVRSRNVGNGSLEVEWDADSGVDSFNVYISNQLNGPYTKANKTPITSNRAIIENFTFNTIVYAKVTSVTGGTESPFSLPANDGYCVRSAISLLFIGPVGDQIPIGAIFAEFVGDGNIIAWKTTASGQLS